MKENLVINISRCRGLYGKFVKKLLEAQTKSGYISWSQIHKKICRGFSVSKSEAKEIMFFLRDVGLIEKICSKGIKLCYEENAKK